MWLFEQSLSRWLLKYKPDATTGCNSHHCSSWSKPTRRSSAGRWTWRRERPFEVAHCLFIKIICFSISRYLAESKEKKSKRVILVEVQNTGLKGLLIRVPFSHFLLKIDYFQDFYTYSNEIHQKECVYKSLILFFRTWLFASKIFKIGV